MPRQLIRTIRRDPEELLPGEARESRDVSVRVLDRLSLGSTAEKLVRGAAAPVLVIPPIPTTKRRQRGSKRAA